MALFVLAFGWTWSFWVPTAVFENGIVEIPASLVWILADGNLGAWGPLLAAIVVGFFQAGRAGVVGVFSSMVRVKFGWIWYVTALITLPAIVGSATLIAWLLGDPLRFRRSTDVGAFPGLTPRRYQSGEIDRSGRISKCGDAEMRRLLVSAATTLMTQVRRFTPLKSWAVRLSGRKGFKKAAVATARKIAVILHAIWRDETEFKWTKEPVT